MSNGTYNTNGLEQQFGMYSYANAGMGWNSFTNIFVISLSLLFIAGMGMNNNNNNGGYGGEKLGGSRYVPPHMRNSSSSAHARSSEGWDEAPRNNRSNDRYYFTSLF